MRNGFVDVFFRGGLKGLSGIMLVKRLVEWLVSYRYLVIIVIVIIVFFFVIV